MVLKHFHYISKSKAEALIGQISPEFHWSKVNPKLQGFGVGIDLTYEREKNINGIEELSRKTIMMIDYLKKKHLAVSLQDDNNIDESKLYYDESEWFHGLYSMRSDSAQNKLTITYALWKTINNSIFLLLGSPLNILGNREVQQGTKYDSSSSQIINGVLEDATSSSFIEALQNKSLQSFNESVFIDINLRNPASFQVNIQNWTYTKRIRTKVNVFRGTALAVFCHEALGMLPQRKIDTMFRIYQTMPVSRAVIPYDVLYLGSPLYTAY